MLNLSLIDRLIVQFDTALRTQNLLNDYPASNLDHNDLNHKEHKETICMLRVNHTGEVCAQALYQGQAVFARNNAQYCNLMQAAIEEQDHLNWCARRLDELGGKTSLLNPFWFIGSFTIGAMASALGDKISLGFLAETEFQVTEHLNKHLNKISEHDLRSKAILERMRDDELKHATNAIHNGAADLPYFAKLIMRQCAKVMTTIAARI